MAFSSFSDLLCFLPAAVLGYAAAGHFLCLVSTAPRQIQSVARPASHRRPPGFRPKIGGAAVPRRGSCLTGTARGLCAHQCIDLFVITDLGLIVVPTRAANALQSGGVRQERVALRDRFLNRFPDRVAFSERLRDLVG